MGACRYIKLDIGRCPSPLIGAVESVCPPVRCVWRRLPAATAPPRPCFQRFPALNACVHRFRRRNPVPGARNAVHGHPRQLRTLRLLICGVYGVVVAPGAPSVRRWGRLRPHTALCRTCTLRCGGILRGNGVARPVPSPQPTAASHACVMCAVPLISASILRRFRTFFRPQREWLTKISLRVSTETAGRGHGCDRHCALCASTVPPPPVSSLPPFLFLSLCVCVCV